VILRDPVHGLVSFEANEYSLIPKLLETREMQRLRRIRQLGLTSFAYPGADHTRFSHAIGAAHVMTRFVRRLQDIQGDLPFWQRLTTERARDAVSAALLHDVGHGPFSHLFEEALPKAPRHEVWTERILTDPESQVHQVLSLADPSLPTRVSELIRGEHSISYLQHTVSGTFDVDRCDYLLRDAHFTGVSYGYFDLDWLLRSLRFGEAESPDQAPPLAIDGDRGLPAIEAFVMARLFMFQQVYFHKATRAADFMLARIIERLRVLLLDGTRLPDVPPALTELVLHDDTSVRFYLEVDDTSLWHGIRSWQSVKDPVLSDLCRRLYERRLFKTFELFGPESTEAAYQSVLQTARDIAEQAGLDPAIYVGLDKVVLSPYDDTKQSLKVLFPKNPPQAPHQVSFLLGRLRGEKLEKTRLIFPAELRPSLLSAVNALRR
jgi:HD superfamily phosphohydrolase